MRYLIGVIIVLILVGFLMKYWYIVLMIGIVALAVAHGPKLVRQIMKRRYFASEEFLKHKKRISSFVSELNEVAEYASEIHNDGSFQLGTSNTGGHAHFATFENTSVHNYRRDRNVADYQSPNVHNCSLRVVRNASANPIEYMIKYFDIEENEESIRRAEDLGESVERLRNAVNNLSQREARIAKKINPPAFILNYFWEEFLVQMGVQMNPIHIPYPEYLFEYVSPGGNSSQRTRITLDPPAIDALIETLSTRVKFKKSAAGQRALMTQKLRNSIKERDNFECRQCAVALADEPHLLLEVDHIVPVSKGGLSTPSNLQTLCWRCNRTKSNKLPQA